MSFFKKRKCIKCNKEFEPKSSTQKFCQKCVKLNRLEYQREYQQKLRAKRKK